MNDTRYDFLSSVKVSWVMGNGYLKNSGYIIMLEPVERDERAAVLERVEVAK